MFTVKGPTNWWRVAAMAAIPLFLYTTWRYAEAQARYAHLLEHLRIHAACDHNAPPPTNPPPAKR